MALSKQLFTQIRWEQHIGGNIPAGYDEQGETYSTRKSSYNMKLDAWLQANKSELNELFTLLERSKNPYFAYDEASKSRLAELQTKFPKYKKQWIF